MVGSRSVVGNFRVVDIHGGIASLDNEVQKQQIKLESVIEVSLDRYCEKRLSNDFL